MNTPTIPVVTFTKQSVVPNFPNEMHEAIVVTGDVMEFAKMALPIAEAKFLQAKQKTAFADLISSGEGSWRAAGGPEKWLSEISIGYVVTFLKMLESGRNSHGSHGWVDRQEWSKILRVIGGQK